MNLTCSVSAGRNFSRTSATSSKRNSILPGFLSSTTQSNTVLCITEPFCSLYSASTKMTKPSRTPNQGLLRTGNSMNCMVGRRHSSIWWHRRNMASTQMKSMSRLNHRSLVGPDGCATREEIGVLTSLPLLKNVVNDLEAARNSGESALTCYFTKESHIWTLMGIILTSGLPIANRREFGSCSQFYNGTELCLQESRNWIIV